MNTSTSPHTHLNGNGYGSTPQPGSADFFCAPDLEEQVIGAMLLEADVCEKILVNDLLNPEDFFTLSNRQVFQAMKALWATGSPIDAYLLQQPLAEFGWSENDALVLLDFPTRVVSTAHTPEHIKQLKKLAIKRQFAKITTSALTHDDPFAFFQLETRGLAINPGLDAEDELSGPLDVERREDLQLGWIDDYATLMTQLTNSPVDFNRLAGIGCVAAAIQRRAAVKMSFGAIYPNVYGVIIAPSSVYHKSSSLHMPRGILQRARLDHLLMSELGTSEGVLKQLAERNCGLIIRDEIGTLFSSHAVKHLITLKPDLTALYDCNPYRRRLSHDSISVEAPYLNILGATTPARFFDGVTLTDWTDGFLARWLYVLPEGEPNFDLVAKPFTAEHDMALNQLAAPLQALDRERETQFVLAEGSHQLWDAWQRKAAREAYAFGDEVRSAIVARYSTYALKFALILAAVNGSWGKIDQTTMETAIHLADNYKATVNQLLLQKSNYGISGAKLQKVLKVIVKQSKGAGVRRRVIAQYANLTTTEVSHCLEKLLEIGAITEETSGRTTVFIALKDELPIKAWK